MTHSSNETTVGSIIEYEVTADHPSALGGAVGVGDTYPAIVTHVDEDTGVYSATVFLPNATFAPVTVDPNTPADASKPDAGEAGWKFDPMTGQAIADPNADPTPEEMGWKFNPETGKPYATSETDSGVGQAPDTGASTDDIPAAPTSANTPAGSVPDNTNPTTGSENAS